MTSFLPSLSNLSPVNNFPAYHGPYDVGTVDVEIPVADLPSPSPVPEGAAETIAFRMFYPCIKPSRWEKSRPVRWIPQPQKATTQAFAKFLGANHKMASLISYLPQQLYWIKIPAHRNAKLHTAPTNNGRWPVTFFSHGLAGSRNAYSYICGDLASNGTVVIALDHRDGSSPIQHVRATSKSAAHTLDSVKITHQPCREAYEGRDKQLRIRLWEMSMAYEALAKIDAGQHVENLDMNNSWSRKERIEILDIFGSKLDIHRPGKVSWAGHSFGACTVVQLLKSIYYHRERPAEADKPLIVPNADAAIVQQITPQSPTLLMDVWCLSFQSPDQAWLYERPLPSYAHDGPKGDNVIAVMSEAFFNWEGNTESAKHIIAAPNTSRRPSVALQMDRDKIQIRPAAARLREESPAAGARDSGYVTESSQSPPPSMSRHASSAAISTVSSHQFKSASQKSNTRTKGPHMFYPLKSQHFNQSDFGVLFPWFAKRFTKAEHPERILELNTRAAIQVMRESGIEVAGKDDREILQKDSKIDSWISIPIADAHITEEKQLADVTRRLSVTSTNSDQAPRDGMTMGMRSMSIET